MSKEMTVVAFGIWVIILPHLGVPGTWHAVITTLTGIAIVILGLYLRAEAMGRRPRTPHHPFVESTHPEDTRPHGTDVQRKEINSLN